MLVLISRLCLFHKWEPAWVKHKHKQDDSSAILNIFRSPPTLLRLRMPYFLVLISHVRTSQAYAYAYRTSGNQALVRANRKTRLFYSLTRQILTWLINELVHVSFVLALLSKYFIYTKGAVWHDNSLSKWEESHRERTNRIVRGK